MLSGIGGSESLAHFGIKTIVDLPDVGQHLEDHPFAANYWTVSSNQTLDDIQRDPDIFAADLAQWEANRTGLFAGGLGNTIGFFRIPEEDSIWEKFTDTTAGNSVSLTVVSRN